MIQTYVIEMLKEDPAVAAWAGDRIWPRQTPDAPTFPCIVVTKVSGRGETDLVGAVDLEEARLQVDCYSDKGQADVVHGRNVVRRLLHGATSTGPESAPCVIQRATCTNDMDLQEALAERAGPRLRRRMLEFRIWNHEEV